MLTLWLTKCRSFVAQRIKWIDINLHHNFHLDQMVKWYAAIQFDLHHTRDNICLGLQQCLSHYLQQSGDHSSPLQMFVILPISNFERDDEQCHDINIKIIS